jgi:hypothetical protein
VILVPAAVERVKLGNPIRESDINAFLENPFDSDSLLRMVREMTNEVRMLEF